MSNKLEDKKVTEISVCLNEIYFNNMERKRSQTKPSRKFI